MKGRNEQKLLKIFLKIFLIVGGIYMFLIIVASPLTKYVIQRYDYTLAGREISLSRAFVNPLGGKLSFKNLKVFEFQSDTVFLFAGKLSADISILKLLTGTYEINSVTILNPEVRIFRDDSLFNFTDLMERFSIVDTVDKKEIHLNVLNINIRNGIVRYNEPGIMETTNVSAINFKSPGLRWNIDSLTGDFSSIPASGRVSGNFMLKIDSLDYRINLVLKDFNLNAFNKYFEKYYSGTYLSSNINLDLNLEGNFNKPMHVKGNGRVDVRDFSFGKDSTINYLSFEKFLVSFREIDPEKKKFYFDSLILNKPFILYQLFDTLDNFRRLIPLKIEENAKQKADTVKMLADLSGADYYLKKFEINDGRIEFNDYSINEKFTFIINHLNINADTIDRMNRRVKISTEAQIYPSGKIASLLSIDPENEKNFDFKYEVRDVAASMFNPYIITYSSFPLDRGTIEMHGEWHVRDNNINSLNHFLVMDPRDTKKVRERDNRWIPLPLIMSFVRERGGVIDYEIPVKGNLNDPAFNVWDVITDLIKNMLVKPPTTPYRLQVRNLRKEVERNLAVIWRMRQFEIEDNQKKFLKGIAEFLKKNPQSIIIVQPVYHEEKEKENILFFQAKKKYFLESNGEDVRVLSEKDSMEIIKISSRDSLFMKYLDKTPGNSGTITLQEKCYRFVGDQIVQETYDYLVKSRKEAFLKYFRDSNTEKQVELKEPVSKIPYNWFSYYDIRYKGGIPESLREAYDKLYDLNEEPPREKFNFRRR